MGPKDIQALRQSLCENAKEFGMRFHRSGRTVEDWEQGRCVPDPLVLDILKRLAERQRRRGEL